VGPADPEARNDVMILEELPGALDIDDDGAMESTALLD